MEQNIVTVQWEGKAYRVACGSKLADCIPLALPCGAHGICGKCRVRIEPIQGEPCATEKEFLCEEELENGVRLACMTKITTDCIVMPLFDKERELVVEMSMDSRREEKPNPIFSHYGAAIDIGTTTVAACLYDTSGRILAQHGRENLQAKYGTDVISRMEAAIGGQAEALAACVQEAINDCLRTMSREGNIEPAEIDALVLTGNTAMLSLLTETDASPLTHAPFVPNSLFGKFFAPNELGIGVISESATVYLPPCISAFVGADMVCALLASGMTEEKQTALLADIGTNGEMALWHDGKLSVCSTAAGPAFEGVGISMGMRGAKGAIDRVWAVNGRLEANVIGGGQPLGICGSGLIDAVAAMLCCEMIDESGYMEEEKIPILLPVALTDCDIRQVQLAKSAICAGMETLLFENGISANAVSKLYLAGGFGKRLNPNNAAMIGMIPRVLASAVEAIGNGALGGASMILLYRDCKEKAEAIAQCARLIELAGNSVFGRLFTEGMMFS